MSLSRSHVASVYRVLRTYLDSPARVSGLLIDLSGTDAYKWNKSFRESVQRLTEYTDAQLTLEHSPPKRGDHATPQTPPPRAQ